MWIRYLICGLCCWGNLLLTAQEVTPTFSFADGLYYNYEEFVRNDPAVPLDQLRTRLVTNPRTWVTQVESLIDRQTGQPIDIDALWGMSIDGIPYIRIPADSIDKPLPAFAGLRITGHLCYFQYERTEERAVEMAAYNPLTGRPFRKAQVKRPFSELRERILRFESGEVAPFTRLQLIQWTSRDRMVQNTLRRLPSDAENLEDQLYNVMLSYNKRHPVFIKSDE